jgi:hypothetical protein
LPGASNVDFIVHVAPQLGARFTQMTAEFAAGGTLGPARTAFSLCDSKANWS